MSRLVTNAIRSTAASSDAITIDSAGKPSFPNGGVGKILQVRWIETELKIDCPRGWPRKLNPCKYIYIYIYILSF